MTGQVSISSTDQVQCDGASWQLLAGEVPAHGAVMDTSLPWPEVLRPPSSYIGDEFRSPLTKKHFQFLKKITFYVCIHIENIQLHY